MTIHGGPSLPLIGQGGLGLTHQGLRPYSQSELGLPALCQAWALLYVLSFQDLQILREPQVPLRLPGQSSHPAST